MTTLEVLEKNALDCCSTVRLSQKIRYTIASAIRKAKRSGVWNKVGQIQKGLLGLCVKLEISFKSKALLTAVRAIIRQMIVLSSFSYENYLRGLEFAQRMVDFAVMNGHEAAVSWLKDKNYAIWWGVFLR